MGQLALALLILVVSLVLIIGEWIPLGALGLLMVVIFVVTGITPSATVLSCFSNGTVILTACSYVMSAAILDSGIAAGIGNKIWNFSKKYKNSDSIVMALIMASVIGLNAMLPRTATTAALMPIVISIAMATGISRTKLLFLLVMTANFGGFNTLMSTPSNTLSNAYLEEAGFEGFGYFEFAKVGIPLGIAGSAVFLLLRKYIVPSYVEEKRDDSQGMGVAGKDVPKYKVWITTLVFIGFILGQMFTKQTGIPSAVVALICASLLIATRVVTEKRAFSSVSWSTIFFIVGILALGKGLEAAGAYDLLATITLDLLGSQPSPFIITAVLFAVSAIATQFMSNVGAAGVLFPIALSIAASLNANPQAAIMAVVFGCGSSFMTPIATPANTMVMEEARLKFGDYVKAGIPLMIVTAIVVIVLVPIIWPFY